ncbi:GNAT family N-acetyltransferase [Aquimarina macrocephali]|uniref:GNAT family N-acetyltransferase n=1 Tax=Aquimarina macrocephali TaxID=666563 RepID=UPI000463502A|nr:GNAT family N-acetyltransferase [Aquimarina macrocephali]
MNITYTVISSETELQQILVLQHNNLPVSISQTEKEAEGFVSVQHDLDILRKMNNKQPHIIAKDGDKVVGYALCMLKDFKEDIELLKPMFSIIENHLDSSISYVIMGQVCIDKAYRKQGIFRGLYQTMKTELQDKYNLLITEVASNNLRSLQAHYAIGFKTLITHESDGTEWHLIHWNWA